MAEKVFPASYTVTNSDGKTIVLARPKKGGAINAPRPGRKHKGQDMGGTAYRGYKLLAPYDGCEILKFGTGVDGNIVFKIPPATSIDFPDGAIIWMMHCEEINTSKYKVGDVVKQGAFLGKLGKESPNKNMHPHLHIEIWKTTQLPGLRDSGLYCYGPNKTWGIFEMHPDCLTRIVGGKGVAASIHGLPDPSYPDAFDYPSEPTKFWSLKEYVDGILFLLATCDDPYLYYYNANQRFKIRASHYIQDMPSKMFDTYFGADWYDSLISHQYKNMDKYNYETMDKLYQSLHRIGYIGYSTPMPKYDEKNNCLIQYMVAPGLYFHDPPLFNTIIVQPEDYIQANTGSVPITGLKYKCIAEGLEWAAITAPGGLYDNEGAYTTADNREDIYGMNRQIKDMSYYYGQYLARADAAASEYEQINGRWEYTGAADGSFMDLTNSGTNIYGRLCELDRLLGSFDHDSISVTFNEFRPDYVAGLPAIVRWAEVDRNYWGMIEGITYMFDPNRGGVQTSVNLRMCIDCGRSPHPYAYGVFERKGIMEYNGGIDDIIHNELVGYYKKHFYPGEFKDAKTASDAHITLQGRYKTTEEAVFEGEEGQPMGINEEIASLQPWQTHRSICTLRQYLTMYKHQKIKDLEKCVDINEISNFTTTSAGNANAVPSHTIESNATKKLEIKNISDIYILERYRIAKKFADLLTNNRVLYYVDRSTETMRPTSDSSGEINAKQVERSDYDYKTMSIPAGEEGDYMNAMLTGKRPSGKQETWSLLRWRINHLTDYGAKWGDASTKAELNRLVEYKNSHKKDYK